ncbi:MAG: hypothetical protein ABL907_07035 [Hyphomicrobium sp.]
MAAESTLNINEEQMAFYWEIGLAITQWSHVEHGLYLIVFRAFENADKAQLSNGFFSIENFRSKLAFVDRVFNASNHCDTFGQEWAAIAAEVRGLATRRNELAHSRVNIITGAPEGRRFAIVPLFGPEPGKKHGRNQPPPGSICLRDIDLTRLQFSRATARLWSLYLRMGGEEDSFAEAAQREPKPQTLVQLKRQMHAMLPPRDGSSPLLS